MMKHAHGNVMNKRHRVSREEVERDAKELVNSMELRLRARMPRQNCEQKGKDQIPKYRVRGGWVGFGMVKGWLMVRASGL